MKALFSHIIVRPNFSEARGRRKPPLPASTSASARPEPARPDSPASTAIPIIYIIDNITHKVTNASNVDITVAMHQIILFTARFADNNLAFC